ncbi:MAG: aldehyde dehydrogenase family protein [Thermomicrobiales bacterium]|nr:aldehyde dehydrogenase family protein [Thermomicrobiales bacterium]
MAVASAPKTWGNYIGGEWVASESGKTFESRSPSNTNDLIGEFAASTKADVEAAIQAATDAAPKWRDTNVVARSVILLKAAEILASRQNEIGRELAREEGKTLKEGIGETGRAIQILRYYAGEAQQPNGEHYPSMNLDTLLYTTREPLGVVGVITPWNFPIAIPAWKIAPALAFGNTVVFKPASATPLLAARFVDALHEAGLPAGVLNMVTGSASVVGDPIVEDDRIAAISFTGSGEVGRKMSVTAAKRGAKIQLELGGQNPAIVLADADMNHALQHVMTGAMWSTGQKCTATSRAIVHRSIVDEFTSKLLEKIEGLNVGDPLDEATHLGPVISAEAADNVVAGADRAKQEGNELLIGGGRLTDDGREHGFFVAPTLFANVDPSTHLGQEEIFGPIMGVIPVDDIDEAIAIANSVKYGLAASIFTRDLGRALHFAKKIQAGIVHINSETPGAEPQVPFGGYKGSSSYSREQGKSARDFYTQVKTVYIDPPPAS